MGRGFGILGRVCLVACVALTSSCHLIPFWPQKFRLEIEVATPEETSDLFVIFTADEVIGDVDRNDLFTITNKETLPEHLTWEHFQPQVSLNSYVIHRVRGGTPTKKIEYDSEEDAPILEVILDKSIFEDDTYRNHALLVFVEAGADDGGWKVLRTQILEKTETVRLRVDGGDIQVTL